MPLKIHDHALCGCRHASTPLFADGFVSMHAPRHYPPGLEIEPIHLDIDLHVEVDAQRASGKVKHTLAVRKQGANTLTLDAVDLDIFEVFDPAHEGGGEQEVSWRYDGKKLTITWPEPGGLERGAERELVIAYQVVEPDSGLFFSSPDAAYPDRDRWACTDHETERARHWLPCVDLPQVRCKLDFHLRADASFTILANGELISEEAHEDGETKTAHWRLDFPCPSYITCFALGEFSRFDDEPFKGLPVAYFAAKHHSEQDLGAPWRTSRW